MKWKWLVIISVVMVLVSLKNISATITKGSSWEQSCIPIEETEEICYNDYCVDYDTYENGTVYCLDMRETYCRNNTIYRQQCQRTLYSGTRYAQNSIGEWVNPSDVLRITKQSDDLTFHYDGIKGYANVTFETGVIYNGNYFSMATVKQNYPEIQFNFPSWKYPANRKYAINITDIDKTSLNQSKIQNITLTYKSHYGFTLSQLKQFNRKFFIKDTMALYFEDLLEKHPLKINKTEKRIYISNISANIVSGSLYLDPTIQLQDADSENLDDITLRDDHTTYSQDVIIIKFNISPIPSGSTIDNASLNLYLYSFIEYGENQWDNDTNITRITNQTWSESTSGLDVNDTWLNERTDINGTQTMTNTTDEWKGLNVLTQVKNDHDAGNSNTSLGLEDPDKIYDGDGTPTVINETYLQLGDTSAFSWRLRFYSKEYTTDASLRPYLNITYSTETNITGCTVMNTVGHTYYLTQDITDSTTSNCMDITANHITFDCQGHTIDGDDSADYGIYSDAVSNITIKNCKLTDWDTRGIYLSQSTNIVGGSIICDQTIDNVTVSSCPDHGIYVDCDDGKSMTIKNSDSNNNGLDGFYLSGDFNSGKNLILTATNLTAKNNSRYGLRILNADNGNITNITLDNNAQFDLFIDTGTQNYCDNVFINITGTGNKPIVYYSSSITLDGWDNNVSEIILCNADNSIINNTQLNNNNGLLLVRTENTTITNSNFSSVYYGLYLYSSNGNTIFGNIIKNNSYGIHLGSSVDSSKIYNNLLNQTNNILLGGTLANYWNTSKQLGTNIYDTNNPYISGNYWTNSSGNGYSDTCTDSNYDGFCDSSYTLATNNIDYLALSDEYDPTPQWLTNTTDIPATYSPTKSYFNITWTSISNFNSIFIESNHTGTATNYTVNNFTDDVFGYNETLSAGTFYWKSYANTTDGYENVTDTWSFTISKNSTSTLLHIEFNGTKDANETYVYEQATNATGYKDVSEGNLTLYRNDTTLGTSEMQTPNETIRLGGGLYNYTLEYLSTENYSSMNIEYWVTINKANILVTVYLNGFASDTSQPSGDSVNMTGTINTSYNVELNLSFNYTGFGDNFETNTGLSVENRTSLTTTGKYNVTSSFAGDGNYSSASDISWLTVTSIDIPSYTSLKTSQTSPVQYSPGKIHQFNSTWTDVDDMDTVFFEWNGSTNYTTSNESSEYYYNFTSYEKIVYESYTYKWFANDTSDNWGSTDSYDYNHTKNTTNPLMLNFTYDNADHLNTNASVFSDTNVETYAWINYPDSGSINLYIDGSLMSNPNTNTFGVGTHDVIANTSGNENYTSNSRTHAIVSTLETKEGGSGGGGAPPLAAALGEYCDENLPCESGLFCQDNLCIETEPLIELCGNDVCDLGETFINCPQDCPSQSAWAAKYMFLIIVASPIYMLWFRPRAIKKKRFRKKKR